MDIYVVFINCHDTGSVWHHLVVTWDYSPAAAHLARRLRPAGCDSAATSVIRLFVDGCGSGSRCVRPP
jgi:hypothetical protein